ncbi:MAG: hypothetical protein IT385_26615 [Deltaproteobacteria bacterium]|nr:hypothetical protein [Deltaproteobacteria bacterium]
MTGNDKKVPPPRRPAPPGQPAGAAPRPAPPAAAGARPAPTSGGAAAPRSGPVSGGAARSPAPGGRPAPPAARPAPQVAEAEDKTSAINLADLGMDEPAEEKTMAIDQEAIKAQAAKLAAARAAKAAAAAAPPPDDSEKTTAFRVEDLPPEDEPKRGPQKTLLGHPSPQRSPGAAVRGGAQPAKRQETLAIAPGSGKPTAYNDDADKTSALSLDDIEKIDAAPPRPAPAAKAPAAARPAAAPARSAPPPKAAPPEDEKTTAFSLDDLDKIDRAPPPKKPAALAAKAVAQIEEGERTVAVPLDDAIAAIDKAPAPTRAAAAAARAAAELEEDDAPPPPRRQQAAAPAKAARPAAARAAASADAAMAPDGFFGRIGYYFTADGRAARGEGEVDAEAKAAGMRNLIIVGGAIGVLTLVFGIIW